MNNETTLQLIYQFLQTQGYTNTINSLVIDSGIAVDHGAIDKPNQLRKILNEHHEFSQCLIGPDPSSLDEMSFEQDLKIQAHQEYANSLSINMDKAHQGGIISVRCFVYDNETFVVSTSSTKEVKLWNCTESLINNNIKPECIGTIMTPSTCLSVEFHPRVKGMIILGTMDGTVKIIKDAFTNKRKEIFSEIIHSKYVIRTKWGKNCFATASYDKTVNFYKLKEGSSSEEGNYEHIQKWSFGGNVEAIEFTPDNIALIIATRGDNYLNYVQLNDLTISRINMNATGDDHVSFTAMYIECSPSGNHLLVQTDKDRIIIMRTHTPIQSKNLYGTVNNELSQPRATWHSSGKYIYGTSQNNIIFTWDVITEEIIDRLCGHTGYPRDLCYHPTKEFLFTCSYDKSIKIWGVKEKEDKNI